MSDFQTGQFIVTDLTGEELVAIDTGGAEVASTTAQAIADLASLTSNNESITALNTVGAGSITAAALLSGIIARGGAQSATPFTDTTVTAAAIIAALPSGAPVGTAFKVTIKNTTDAAETIAGGVGVTVSGIAVIPKLTWAEYLLTKTAADAVTLAYVRGGQINALLLSQLTTISDVTTTTQVGGLTGAQTCNILITGTVAPFAIQLPTAAEIYAALGAPAIGLNYQLNIMNARTTTGIGTLTGNTGLTLTGLATLTGVNSSGIWNVNIVSATAITLTRVGGS